MLTFRNNLRGLLSRLTMLALAVAVAFAGSIAQAAGPAATNNVASGPVVPCDIDQFANNIKQAVHGKCVGYSVAIFRNGKLQKRFAGGLARRSTDGQARSMSIHDQIELASISKTVNSIALLRALQEKNIPIGSSIYPYLPGNWNVHKSIKNGKVTFIKLLSHTSGLKYFDRWDESKYAPGNYNDHVKEAVKLGVINPQTSKYNNNNFELIRVLLAYVVNKKTAKYYEAAGKTKAQETYFASLLAAYANTRVFSPAGIFGKPRLKDKSASTSVRYYDFAKPSGTGVPGNDRTKYPGRGGWKMTATEIAALISAWNSNRMLSVKMTGDMKKFKLGVFNGTDAFGIHYKHNGKSHTGNRASKTQYMSFTKANIQVALLVNSENNTFGNKATLLQNAFEAACKSPDLVITKLAKSGSPYYQSGKLVVPVIATVYNRGSADAKGNFAVGVKRFGDWKWVNLTGTLGAKKARNVKVFVKIPDLRKRLDGRTIKLTAMADAPVAAADTSMPKWGRVKESNESNNTKVMSVPIVIPKRVGSKTGSKTKTAVKKPVRRIERKPKGKSTRRPLRRQP